MIMKCPYCGQELPDGASFCSNCGAQLSNNVNNVNYNNNVNPIPQGMSQDNMPLTAENFRDQPNYRKNLLKMVLFSGLGFLMFSLSMVGSLLMNYAENAFGFGLALLLFGIVGGVVFMFGFALPMNKKIFPNVNVKMKGIEFLIPVFIAFGMAAFVVALAFQGLTLIIN